MEHANWVFKKYWGILSKAYVVLRSEDLHMLKMLNTSKKKNIWKYPAVEID